MSPFCHVTDEAHDGRSDEDVTDDQEGSPEREIEVTFQERATADLQIREPLVPINDCNGEMGDDGMLTYPRSRCLRRRLDDLCGPLQQPVKIRDAVEEKFTK